MGGKGVGMGELARPQAWGRIAMVYFCVDSGNVRVPLDHEFLPARLVDSRCRLENRSEPRFSVSRTYAGVVLLRGHQ